MKIKYAQLSDVAKIDRVGIEANNIKSGTIYIGLEHIDSNGKFLGSPVINNGELASTKFVFSKQHILYGKLRPYLCKIACPSFDGICSTDILPILPKSNIDKNYLYHYLRLPKMIELATTRSSGANLPRVSPKVLGEFEIPLPSLDEQRRIAAILDIADALREKRRQAIAKLDTLLQSVFLDMFGDPVTNPMKWNVGSIELVVKDKSDVRCGPFGTQLKVHELVSEGIPLFGIENVLNNQFIPKVTKFLTKEKAKQLSAFSVKPNDVLVTRMGTIGRACVIPPEVKEGVISYHLFRVRPDQTKCLPQFLAYTICRSGTFQAQLRQLSHGAIMDGLSTGNLKAVRFLLPPIPSQKRYVEYVEKTESTLIRQNISLRKSDELFQSLQQRAFNGELFTTEIEELKALSEVSGHG